MRALTVWQPWASLIAHGFKRYEFRRWRAPERFVGERIAIHAGSRKPTTDDIWSILDGIGGGEFSLGEDVRELIETTGLLDYPLGAIVATAVLGEPLPPAKVAAAAGFSETRGGLFNWAWPLSDVEMVEPIACKGSQGFWHYKGYEMPEAAHG